MCIHNTNFVIGEAVNDLPFSATVRKTLHKLNAQILMVLDNLYIVIGKRIYKLNTSINTFKRDSLFCRKCRRNREHGKCARNENETV